MLPVFRPGENRRLPGLYKRQEPAARIFLNGITIASSTPPPPSPRSRYSLVILEASGPSKAREGEAGDGGGGLPRGSPGTRLHRHLSRWGRQLPPPSHAAGPARTSSGFGGRRGPGWVQVRPGPRCLPNPGNWAAGKRGEPLASVARGDAAPPALLHLGRPELTRREGPRAVAIWGSGL